MVAGHIYFVFSKLHIYAKPSGIINCFTKYKKQGDQYVSIVGVTYTGQTKKKNIIKLLWQIKLELG